MQKETRMGLKIKSIMILVFLSACGMGQVPILNSNPSVANKVIYLDFDGQNVVGTGWNSGNLITALPSTMNAANIILIHKRVSEDFIPFDVNVTTDSLRFNNALPNRRTRVVITPTSAWYGSAGGVAYVGSFAWGGTPGTPCWVFENLLSYSPKNIAEAASHESGHTLTLRHQSTYSVNTCSKTAEYNPGQGSGVTSWAPIMGVGYTKNVTTWYNGLSSVSCTLTQNDHGNIAAGITSPNFLNFLPDDVGNTLATAKILNLNTLNLSDSGLVTEPADLDAYTFNICNNRLVTIDVKPWALDTVNYSGANLDVRLFLYNAASNILAVDTPLAKLNARIGMNLPAGTYWFTIDGGRSANYSDYGSLGRYYLNIKATNPPTLTNTIVANNTICAGQTSTLGCNSNGSPAQWFWTLTGASGTSNYTSPSISINSAAGIYTVSLLATSNFSSTCLTTLTLAVYPVPTLAVSASTNYLCVGSTVTLSASGAFSYTWLPGASTGTALAVSPPTISSYTLSGSNGTCVTSAVSTVSVSPDFTVTAAASATNICVGSPVTLTGSGASGFTLNPGGISANPVVVFPAASAIYTLSGISGGCIKTTTVGVGVSPHFNIHVVADSTFCMGDTLLLYAWGANGYTFNPGNYAGSQYTVSPAATTVYTITALATGNMCLEDTTVTLSLRQCDYIGLKEETGNSGIRIYPNPAQAQLTIETGLVSGHIEVYNALGQLILSQPTGGEPLLLSTGSWTRGVYLVRVSSGAGPVYLAKLVLN
jgi:hypothetical protein